MLCATCHTAAPCASGWRLRLSCSCPPVLAQPAAAQGGAWRRWRWSRRRRPDRLSRRAVGGFKKIDGFFPLYWDEAGRPPLAGDAEAEHRGPLLHRHRRRARVERHRHRPRRPRRVPHHHVRARGPAGAGGPAELSRSAPSPQPGRGQRGARRLRPLGHLELSRWPPRPATACSSTRPSSSSATRPRWPAALQPGTYRFEPNRSSIYLPMTQNFPKNTEMEVELTFVRQPRRRGRRPGGGRGGAARSKAWPMSRRRRRPRASACTTRSSSCRTPTTSRAPSIRGPATAASRYENFSAPLGQPMTRALHPPSSPREEGSDGGGQRAGQADRLLPRSGRAGADPLRAARGRRAGGTRRSRRPAIATRSASRCCPRASARSTSATTSSTGCTARRAAGARAAASPIRAPARSSRASSTLGSLRASRTT